MSRLITAGAELQSTDPLTEGTVQAGASPSGVTGSFSISTATKRSGEASFEVTAGALNALAFNWTAVASRAFYGRAWIYLPALPDVARKIMDLRASTVQLAYFECATDGTLSLAGTAAGGTSTLGTVAAGTWFCVEFSVISTATGSSLVVRLNGTQVLSTSWTLANQLANNFRVGNLTGTVNAAWKVNFDDLAVNDDQGANQNTWAGTAGKVVLLRPAADFAVGADWKLGTGTSPAGAAFDSVNNTPPLGVGNGAAGSDPKQIRDAVSNASGAAADAEFTFETFATRIAAGATVRLIQLFTATAETSNSPTMVVDATITDPSQTATTFNGTATTVSTYPTLWDRTRGPVVYNPGLALSAAPRARVGKRTATTNTLVCCAIGLVVEYDTSTSAGLVGQADATFGAAASSLVGKGVLTAQGAAISFSASGALHGGGKLSGSTAIRFSGVVLPPTGVARLSGTSQVRFNALLSAFARQLVGSSAISFTGVIFPPTGTARLAGTARIGLTANSSFNLALPPKVSDDFKARWASAKHIGAAAPTQLVEIQTGRYNRRYAFYSSAAPAEGDIGFITDRPAQVPWQAFWDADGPWQAIPNVLQIDLEGNFEQKGVKQATIQIENIVSQALAGGGHVFKRGLMAPLRGYVAPGRTQLHDELGAPVTTDATWFEKLNRDARIRTWEGYGDLLIKTFDGIIDNVDTQSAPDRMTIVARMGKPLTDERVFGWNHDPYIKDPVTFISQDDADQITRVATNVAASTEFDGASRAEMAVDSDSATGWESHEHTDPGVTEWIQIRVPAGRYSDFLLGPELAGYDIWVSVQPKMVGLATPATLDGVAINENVWHDGGSGQQVPGDNGGIAYMTHVTNISDQTVLRSLGGEFVMGDDSIIRVSFRNLANFSRTAFEPPSYRASARQFFARRRVLNPDAVTQKWVIVGDMSDIIRTILLWAGYHEWEVENTGVILPKKLVVNRGMTYMDVIDTIKDAIGFDFFMADPSLADGSLGVPTFRRSRAVTNDAPQVTVRDTDLLTAIKVHQTDETLGYIIRMRGRITDIGGTALGGDKSKRIMFTFRPPWADRMGGVLKHVILHNNLFNSLDDVKFGAYFVALQQALGSATAVIEIPAYPFIELDDHVELLDLGTGLSTRLNIRDRKSTSVGGEKAIWKMTLTGALVDVPDVQEMVDIINNTPHDA
jgi:hypothetical protein